MLKTTQAKHQSGEERVFKQLWLWHCCWCQKGWSEYFKNHWSTWIFTFSLPSALQRMLWKGENIQWATLVWKERPCFVTSAKKICRRVQNTGSSSDNQPVQLPSPQHFEPSSICATAAKDHNGCHCWSLRRGNWHPDSRLAQRNWIVTDLQGNNWEKHRLNVCWFNLRQIRGGINRERIDSFSLVPMLEIVGGAMVWIICSGHLLGPLVPTVSSVSINCLYHFMAALYPLSSDYFQQNNAPCYKAQIILSRILKHDNDFNALQQLP